MLVCYRPHYDQAFKPSPHGWKATQLFALGVLILHKRSNKNGYGTKPVLYIAVYSSAQTHKVFLRTGWNWNWVRSGESGESRDSGESGGNCTHTSQGADAMMKKDANARAPY
jgi:hypothetical protein